MNHLVPFKVWDEPDHRETPRTVYIDPAAVTLIEPHSIGIFIHYRGSTIPLARVYSYTGYSSDDLATWMRQVFEDLGIER